MPGVSNQAPMQFMALARRRTEAFSEEEFAKYLDEEAEALRRMYAEGPIRQAWSRGDILGAVLLIEADTLEHAETIVGRLPLAQKGMLETQIISLRGYRGFGPRN